MQGANERFPAPVQVNGSLLCAQQSNVAESPNSTGHAQPDMAALHEARRKAVDQAVQCRLAELAQSRPSLADQPQVRSHYFM